MKTMRERLARRLATSLYGSGHVRTEKISDIEWAAIDAILDEMREPDEGMIEAGAYQIPVGQGCEEGPVNTDDARDCWQAMIDHARHQG